MVVNKRKKVTKYRSHTTHGGGHRKKRRGAGSRGGRGRAGTGKRASHKKEKLGSKGFVPRRSGKAVSSVNIGYFTLERAEKLVTAGKMTKQGDSYSVNLADLRFNKLLGTGNINIKLNVTTTSFSKLASEKITAAGGVISSEKKSEEKSE